MRGQFFFRHPPGLALLCVLLVLGCRVRSTRPSPESTPAAIGAPTASVPELAAPRDEPEDEEQFWPSVALRPVNPPGAAKEQPEEVPTSPPPEFDPNQLMTAPIAELPALAWVPALVSGDVPVSTDQLDAAAMQLARSLKRYGRAALPPALDALARSRWPQPDFAPSLSLQSSLGHEARVQLQHARALQRATAAVWGVGPRVNDMPEVDDSLMLDGGVAGPVLLMMRMPVAPAEPMASGVVSERPGLEYVSIVLWGTPSEGAAMGMAPVRQVTGEHGVVAAFSGESGVPLGAAAQAAYAALIEQGARSAADVGLAEMGESTSSAIRGVAVLSADDVWIASNTPSLLFGMTERLRDNYRLVQARAPERAPSPISRVKRKPTTPRRAPESSTPARKPAPATAVDTTGARPVGARATGANTAGLDTAGANTAGLDTAGAGPARTSPAGASTVGAERVSASPRARDAGEP